MFRRIQVLHEPTALQPSWISGLMFVSHMDIIDAWMPPDGSGLRGNTRAGRPDNMRFYFTEKGWRLLGRNVIAALRLHGQRYRVIAVKETDAQVAWRDKHSDLEVALQPRKRRVS
jgi:hypothetical protein